MLSEVMLFFVIQSKPFLNGKYIEQSFEQEQTVCHLQVLDINWYLTKIFCLFNCSMFFKRNTDWKQAVLCYKCENCDKKVNFLMSIS